MSTTIDIHDLPGRFQEMIDRAISGEQIIVTSSGNARASLTPLHSRSSELPRIAGLHSGSLEMSADFDTPLSDDFWMGNA